MRFIHIFSAVVWLIAMVGVYINWWFGEPISAAGRMCIFYAICYTTCALGWKALDSLDEILIIWDQRMDRRPRA